MDREPNFPVYIIGMTMVVYVLATALHFSIMHSLILLAGIYYMIRGVTNT